MAHDSLWDMSTAPASNTSIAGINIGEGCAPSGINDAIRTAVAQALGAILGVTASGTDTYTATLAPAPDALTDGMMAPIRFTNANTSTTPTLNINGLGAKVITTRGGQALAAGDIPAKHEALLRYVGATSTWELLNPKNTTFNGGTITTPLAVNDPSSTDAPLLTVQKSGSSVFASDDTALLTIQSATAPNDAVKLRFATSGTINDFGVSKATGNQVLKVNITGTPRTAQTWFGSGGVNIGAPTGGDKGNGSLNVAGGLYLNGTQIQAPQVAKAWGVFEGTAGAGLASFNVTSVSKVGTGQYEITLSTPFGASFAVVGSFQASTGAHSNQLTTMRAYAISGSVIGVDVFRTDSNGFLDPAFFSIAAFGN